MADGEDSGETTARRPAEELMVLRELDQIKVLADPLRVQILSALFQERTTKQVAELLGEKPTKLYHHMEALEKVGLVELTRTRQNRGTLEKYYLAVARGFRADPAIFTAEKPSTDELSALRSMVTTVLDSTSAEIMQCIDRERNVASLQTDGLLACVELRLDWEEIVELRRRLQETMDWIMSLNDPDVDLEDPELERFRLSIAYFPLKEPRRKMRES